MNFEDLATDILPLRAASLPLNRLDAAATLRQHLLERQRELNGFYLRQLSPPSRARFAPRFDEDGDLRRYELHWNEQEEARLDLSGLPTCAEAFEPWYRRLHRQHRLEVAPFFEYLAHEATLDEMALYLGFEAQVDGRFDDVIAMAQLGMTGDMKLALAENYWDEMGNGELARMHTRLFARSIEAVDDVLGGARRRPVPVEALKNGNLLLMWALNRNYTSRLLGALAILEHTAPYRFSRTVHGMRRLGLPPDAIHYHELHIEVDANHGRQLLRRVLKPLVQDSVWALREVCIGCLVRRNVARDYYDGMADAFRTLGRPGPSSPIPSFDEGAAR
ncbi:MAG: iron-containing redox enzyme family protein [Comamonadaceae bacterium]|nr:MAG: iron-containing redox enzyme family protein [Comamonadaceae bacterium]